MPRRPIAPARCLCLVLALGTGLSVPARAGAPPAAGAPAPARRRLRLGLLPVAITSEHRDLAASTADLVHELLGNVLFQEGGFSIVERTDPRLLGRIVDELAFQNQGLVAEPDGKALGRLAGIEAFVLTDGDLTVRVLGTGLDLRVRLVDVESSKLLAVFRVRGRGRPRLTAWRSAREAVGAAMDDLASQLHRFRLPAADGM
jgi:hypothetical protein